MFLSLLHIELLAFLDYLPQAAPRVASLASQQHLVLTDTSLVQSQLVPGQKFQAAQGPT